jgi:hypothetical protein
LRPFSPYSPRSATAHLRCALALVRSVRIALALVLASLVTRSSEALVGAGTVVPGGAVGEVGVAGLLKVNRNN